MPMLIRLVKRGFSRKLVTRPFATSITPKSITVSRSAVATVTVAPLRRWQSTKAPMLRSVSTSPLITMNVEFDLVADQPQRADRAKRLGLVGVGDAHVPLPAIAAEALDDLPQVARRDVHVLDIVASEPFDQQLKHRLRLHRHQRLGQNHGVGPKPRPLAPALDNDLHPLSPAKLRNRPAGLVPGHGSPAPILTPD